MSKAKDRRLMDEVHDVMHLHHYSIHTERSYCEWIKHFIQFHKMTSREDLKNGEIKKEINAVSVPEKSSLSRY